MIPNKTPPTATPTPFETRVIEKIQKVELPGGIVREIRTTVVTTRDQGVWKTRDETTMTPPLDCGCVIKDIYDVTICHLCQKVVCVSKHAFTCPKCGQNTCIGCRAQIGDESAPVFICADCAAEANTPKVIRFFKKWILGVS
jgi:predicted RNA-binding Zn-ribbon protein involved in translation (DUF1610 family)